MIASPFAPRRRLGTRLPGEPLRARGRWPLRRSLAVVSAFSLAVWLAALAWVLS